MPDTEIAIVEAMKMHIPVSAEQAGRVAKWLVEEKSLVAEGQALLELEGERVSRAPNLAPSMRPLLPATVL